MLARRACNRPKESQVASANVSAGLASAELFRGLAPAELERLERVAHRRHYDPGAVIVQEGQGGIAFFIVTSWGGTGLRQGSGRQPQGIPRIGPGGVVAAEALVSD